MIKKIIYLLLILQLVSQEKINLEKAIDIALEENLERKINLLDLDYSNKNILQGYLTFAPTATIDHSLVRLNDYNLQISKLQTDAFKELLRAPAIGLGYIADQIPNTAFRDIYRTSLNVSMTIFEQGLALNELSRRKNQHKILEIESDELKLQTVYNVREAFFTLYIVQEMQKVNLLRKESTEKRIEQVKRFIENGLRNNAELLRWQLQAAKSDEAIIESENQLNISRSQFSYVLGVDLKSLYQAELNADFSKELFAELTKDYIENLDSKTLQGVKKIMLQKDIADNSEFYTYGKFLPRIDLKYNRTWQQSDIAFPAEQPADVSLNFSWEIFSSFKDVIELQKNQILSNRANLLAQDTERQIQLQLMNLYFSLEKARKQLKSGKQQLEFAEENYRIMKNRYESGLVNYIDLVDSEIEFFSAKIESLNTYKNYVLSGYSIKKLLNQY